MGKESKDGEWILGPSLEQVYLHVRDINVSQKNTGERLENKSTTFFSFLTAGMLAMIGFGLSQVVGGLPMWFQVVWGALLVGSVLLYGYCCFAFWRAVRLRPYESFDSITELRRGNLVSLNTNEFYTECLTHMEKAFLVNDCINNAKRESFITLVEAAALTACLLVFWSVSTTLGRLWLL